MEYTIIIVKEWQTETTTTTFTRRTLSSAILTYKLEIKLIKKLQRHTRLSATIWLQKEETTGIRVNFKRTRLNNYKL